MAEIFAYRFEIKVEILSNCDVQKIEIFCKTLQMPRMGWPVFDEIFKIT